MKRINLNAMRLTPVTILVMILVGKAMAFGSSEVEKEKREHDEIIRIAPYVPPKVTPPTRVRGVESLENIVIMESANPLQLLSYEVYPDKFILWTTDSVSTAETIENSNFIKNVENDGEDTWKFTVMTGDVKKGKQLCSLLKEEKGVIRVENFGYSKGGRELIPSEWITLRLCDASDSVRLKSIADSLHLIAYKEEGVFNPGLDWNLQLTMNTKASRPEIVEIIQNIVKPKFCRLLWDGDRFYPAFTYDTYINRQWGLYNRHAVSQPLKKKYMDIDISRGWNLATGRGVNICIIDVGLDSSNEDIKGNLKA